MGQSADLRAQAQNKRRSAALARRIGPGLSLSQDRQMMLELSQELETEAARLDAEADALDRST
jgi:hypothetical protein